MAAADPWNDLDAPNGTAVPDAGVGDLLAAAAAGADAPIGIATVDRNLRFTMVNRRMQVLNGMGPSAHLGRTPGEVFPGPHGAEIERRFRAALDAGAMTLGVHLEGPRASDGEHLSVVADYFPLRDATGGIAAAACLVRDISETEQLQQLLTRTSVMMESLAGAAPVGVAFFDTDGRYVVINDHLAAINGVAATDHVGRSISEVVPHLSAAVDPILAQVLSTGEPVVDLELTGETAARPGVQRQWQASFFRVEAPGDVFGVGCVAKEVTEERRVQRRLRNLIDSLFTFVGLCEPDGTLVEANRAALEAAGLDAEDVLGRPFWEAYWWSHDPEVQERLRRAVRDAAAGRPSRYDAVVRVREGRLITIDFQLVPIVEDGQVSALVPSGLDITERLAAAARVEATGELARRLAGTQTSTEAVEVMLELAATATGAAFCTIALLDDDGRAITHHQPASLPVELADRHRHVSLDAPSIVADAIRLGEARVVERPEDFERRYAHLWHDITSAGLSTVAAFPLRSSGVVLGALGLGWAERRSVTSEERAQIDTVVKLCAQTLDRTRRGDRQRSFLTTLQNHLLPPVPRTHGLEIAVRYEPATDHLGFGGDWYDVHVLDDQRTVVVVGDIVGHGIEAAARMSQVRGVLNGLLRTQARLDDLFAIASRAVGDGSYLGTAAVALVDLGADVVEYACAGHPPPLVRRPDGSVEVLDRGRFPVLGLPTTRRATGRVPFSAGSTLVLFTDGLVERRGEPIDTGVHRVGRALTADPVDVLADHLVHSLGESGGRPDDIALAVVRRPPLPV